MGKVEIKQYIFTNRVSYKNLTKSDIRRELNFDINQFESYIVNYISEEFHLEDFDNVDCFVYVYIKVVKDNCNIDYDIPLCDVKGVLDVDVYVDNKFLLLKEKTYTFDEPKLKVDNETQP